MCVVNVINFKLDCLAFTVDTKLKQLSVALDGVVKSMRTGVEDKDKDKEVHIPDDAHVCLLLLIYSFNETSCSKSC
jgi:hypothetical protein